MPCVHCNRLTQVRTPKIKWEMTTRQVLTMEWIEGVKLTDRAKMDAAGLDIVDFVNIGIQCTLRQLLEAGFFHADPHPGAGLLLQPATSRSLILLQLLDAAFQAELHLGLWSQYRAECLVCSSRPAGSTGSVSCNMLCMKPVPPVPLGSSMLLLCVVPVSCWSYK